MYQFRFWSSDPSHVVRERSPFHLSRAAARTASKSQPGMSAARLPFAPSAPVMERATFTSSASPAATSNVAT